jgi:2',3'-cyclic-nucleotide 2'-phosphodiesterase (5'-nucleotidase family)
MTALVIIHTSDLHGRLSKAAAQVLRQLKSAHGALLVDSGDALPLPNFLAVPWRLAVAARLAEARYDALALGNREWFFWAWGLAWTARGLPCPLVATNLALDERTGVKRQVLCATAGGQVAILGLARRMLPERSGPAPLGMVRWLPPTACLPAALAQARQRAQWVVVLSHLGLK